MSTFKRTRHKGMAQQKPQKEFMTYCGEYQIREGGPEHGSDGINGTVVAPQSKIEAAGAGAGEEVQVLVEANGKTVTTKRQIHKSGNTLTIPLKERQELDLEPGDTIRFWVDEVEDDEASGIDKEQQQTLREEAEDDDKELIVIIGNSLTYHLLESEHDEETACGRSLEDESFRIGEDPGDVLDPCHDCKARSSKPMTNEEIVDWLADEVGFARTDGPSAYFNKEQLTALKDRFVELRIENEDLEEKAKSYQARNARLHREIKELGDQ